MFETVAVLVVFFFLLGSGFALYFSIQKSSITRESELANQQHAFNTLLSTLFAPELNCQFLSTTKDNCIDLIKLQDFAQLLTNQSVRTDYYPLFGESTITVFELYPEQHTWKLYQARSSAETIASRNSILLYDPITDQYSFGLIEVDTHV